MPRYTLINILIVFFPLVLSFDKKVAFYQHWPALGLAILTVGSVFILWDAWVTRRGDWWFTAEFTGKFRLLGLPLGEWLFFITVPYACIFVFEVLGAYFPPQPVDPPWWIYLSAGLLVLTGGLVFRRKGYTLLVSLVFVMTMALLLGFYQDIFRTTQAWLYLAVTLGLFALVNSFLAGLPIVNYHSGAIIGIRVITFPLEDIFYNTAYLVLTLLAYTSFSRLLAGP